MYVCCENYTFFVGNSQLKFGIFTVYNIKNGKKKIDRNEEWHYTIKTEFSC